MNPAPRLEISIKEHLAPLLRADGFSGSGRTFRRVVGDFVQVINVQGSRYGGQFAVNLAIQPLCILDVVGEVPDPKKITEELCEFRRRLSESNTGQWWEHDGSQESMNTAIKAAAIVYCTIGRQIFENFNSSVPPMHLVTPEAFENGQYNFQGFGSSNVRMALALARLWQAKGHKEAAKKFAIIGLATIGNASGLRRELESIVEYDHPSVRTGLRKGAAPLNFTSTVTESKVVYLKQLILRMCLSEPGVNSDDSISWHAHREAEQLFDPEIMSAAMAYLNEKRGKNERRAAYFIIGKLGMNLASTEASRYLIHFVVPFESDKHALSSALDLIEEIPIKEDEDISPIINLLLDKRWLVRHSAIRALRSSNSSIAEPNLIALLKYTSNDFDRCYCHITLADIGTEKSLPVIQVNVSSRKRDVKSSALYAIEKIKRRVATFNSLTTDG